MKYQKKDLSKFPKQIEYALKTYKKHGLVKNSFQNIVLAGLGGSGIAGRIVKAYYQKSSPIPIEVISDYKLPQYVNKKTLVILNSYSGNTEETLSAYMDAFYKGASMLVITTGGILFELAEENKIPVYLAEQGYQPRMALGYSLTFLFLILAELFDVSLDAAFGTLQKQLANTDYYIDKANIQFCGLNADKNKKWVMITDPESFPIGLRFSQQINENAKGEAFVHELPEANHNVIESYNRELDSVFVFLYGINSPKLNHRFNFLESLLNEHHIPVIRINLKEFNLVHIYETIYILDWLSLMVADSKQVKSDEIPNINRLKDYMKGK